MEKNQRHFSVGCCVHKKNCPFDEIISFRQLKLPQRNSLNIKKVQFWKYYGNFSIKRAWKIIIITIIIIIKIRRNIIICFKQSYRFSFQMNAWIFFFNHTQFPQRKLILLPKTYVLLHQKKRNTEKSISLL